MVDELRQIRSIPSGTNDAKPVSGIKRDIANMVISRYYDEMDEETQILSKTMDRYWSQYT